MTSLKSFLNAKSEPWFSKGTAKMEPMFVYGLMCGVKLSMGTGWILSCSLINSPLSFSFHSVAQLCTRSLVYRTACVHTHMHALCLHTKSIRHSSKKMKAILIIQAVFVHAHTHNAEKEKECRSSCFMFFLCVKRDRVWEWLSLSASGREGMKNSAEGEKEHTVFPL